MHFVVYVNRSGNLATKNLWTKYEDVAIGEVSRNRVTYGWIAYRVFFDDGITTACVASWGEFPS